MDPAAYATGDSASAVSANASGAAVATADSATPYWPAMAWQAITSTASSTAVGRHDSSPTGSGASPPPTPPTPPRTASARTGAT